MKNNYCLKRKSLLVLLLGFSIIAMTMILTFALQKTTIPNEFKVERLNVVIKEEFNPPKDWKGDFVTKIVIYENTGTTPVYLRVKNIENITSDTTAFLSTKHEGKDVIKKQWTNEGKWTYQDGWYYYNYILEPSQSVQLLNGIEVNPDITNLPEPYKAAVYNVSFLDEYLNTADSSDLEAWKINQDKFHVSNDGSINWGF